jgi:hypothetical protein
MPCSSYASARPRQRLARWPVQQAICRDKVARRSDVAIVAAEIVLANLRVRAYDKRVRAHAGPTYTGYPIGINGTLIQPIHIRLLALARTDGDDLQRDLSVQTFRRLVLLHLCVQEWFVWMIAENPPYSMHVVMISACAYTLGLCFGWRAQWSRAAFAFVFVVSTVKFANQFPVPANHHYLELGVLALGTLFDDREKLEAQLLLQSCRWLVATVLFWAGLQKVLHGYYFGGEFLSYAISQETRFAQIFGVLVPGEELVRLQSFGQQPPLGAGPYRASSWTLILVSNATYLLEILTAIGLLIRRTRPIALCVAMALVVAIEVVAREIFFGALMLGLIALFARRALNWQLFPMFVLVYAYLLTSAFGLVPTWGAH